MTKRELLAKLANHPDDAIIGLMYNGGDTCRLEYIEGSGMVHIVPLQPIDCKIAN